jgi:integrase
MRVSARDEQVRTEPKGTHNPLAVGSSPTRPTNEYGHHSHPPEPRHGPNGANMGLVASYSQGMAWAEQLPSGNWRACWRDLDGKKHTTARDPISRKPFIRKVAAERIAGAKEDDARRGLATADGRAPTWDAWCAVWLNARKVESSTHQQDMIRLERHLRPKWGKRRLNTITRRQVQDWVNDLSSTRAVVPVPKVKPEGWVEPERTLAPSTVDKILRLFSASMKAATLDERVPLNVNPCIGIKVPAIASGHERYLTRDEVEAISYRLNEPWRTAWLLLVGTGLRFGELAGLHWHRVTDDSIVVQETWDPVDKRIKAYPKSKKPRTIPIMPWVRPVLDAQRARTGSATTCGQRHAGGAKCRSGLVIVTPRTGGPLDGRRFGQRQFAEAVAHAGLHGVRLHDGRHTFASWLRQGGVDLETVQQLLGHASIITTQRYSDLGETQLDKVLAAMS